MRTQGGREGKSDSSIMIGADIQGVIRAEFYYHEPKVNNENCCYNNSLISVTGIAH